MRRTATQRVERRQQTRSDAARLVAIQPGVALRDERPRQRALAGRRAGP